ncbi:conserved hypothetical protein [Culex quinquefasciatus]|uniref:Uncharacterized protein n=1 Tax=Culex quinquefasciatus TaxID=7176 RepID=B0WS77_CULQU|nr:conserved hypothetical protein [Culex quinquefasciatus]|eukprot:XP_001851561.1 conserved hypothetical protein [Culex quinquefasciatus]
MQATRETVFGVRLNILVVSGCHHGVFISRKVHHLTCRKACYGKEDTGKKTRKQENKKARKQENKKTRKQECPLSLASSSPLLPSMRYISNSPRKQQKKARRAPIENQAEPRKCRRPEFGRVRLGLVSPPPGGGGQAHWLFIHFLFRLEFGNIHRTTEQQNNRTTEQQNNRTTEQQNNRTTEQQNNKTTE